MECTLSILIRPFRSGLSTTTRRSKRPGRSRAGSRTSGRLVAPSTRSPLVESNPSISERSWFRVCSRSSLPPRTAVTAASNGVNLINKDNTWRILSGVLKQITDTGRAHAHEHLHKVRTGKGIKRHMGLTRHCLGKQGLTSSGGPKRAPLGSWRQS